MLAWLLLWSLGCLGDDDDLRSDALEAAAQDEMGGSSFLDCGSVTYSNSDDGSCGSLATAEGCALDAFESCERAIMRKLAYTAEGDPIPSVWLLSGADGDCAITELVDHSQDAWRGDYGPRQKFLCGGLEVHDNGSCVFATTTDCELIAEW